jgi:hypothetical protein
MSCQSGIARETRRQWKSPEQDSPSNASSFSPPITLLQLAAAEGSQLFNSHTGLLITRHRAAQGAAAVGSLR